MKKLLAAMGVMIVAMLLMCASSSQAEAAPTVEITVQPQPPSEEPLQLAVGESRTFEIRITSSEPFVVAIAMTDEYYPGRGVHWHGNDRAVRDTSAVLHLTITGKNSTANLAAVCGWPEPGYCWPAGAAPVNLVVGARYRGGGVVAQQFPFSVEVP